MLGFLPALLRCWFVNLGSQEFAGNPFVTQSSPDCSLPGGLPHEAHLLEVIAHETYLQEVIVRETYLRELVS